MICIDAFRNLKVLKLTGCVNIEGHGLDVLRGSLVLECIESHKHQNDKAHSFLHNNDNLPQSNLSPNIIISLLESIVASPGNKLQYMYFPNIIKDDDRVALVDNSTVLHVCEEQGSTFSRCGAIVKQRRTRTPRRPDCLYCQCKDIDLVMSQAGCSNLRPGHLRR